MMVRTCKHVRANWSILPETGVLSWKGANLLERLTIYRIEYILTTKSIQSMRPMFRIGLSVFVCLILWSQAVPCSVMALRGEQSSDCCDTLGPPCLQENISSCCFASARYEITPQFSLRTKVAACLPTQCADADSLDFYRTPPSLLLYEKIPSDPPRYLFLESFLL